MNMSLHSCRSICVEPITRHIRSKQHCTRSKNINWEINLQITYMFLVSLSNHANCSLKHLLMLCSTCESSATVSATHFPPIIANRSTPSFAVKSFALGKRRLTIRSSSSSLMSCESERSFVPDSTDVTPPRTICRMRTTGRRRTTRCTHSAIGCCERSINWITEIISFLVRRCLRMASDAIPWLF